MLRIATYHEARHLVLLAGDQDTERRSSVERKQHQAKEVILVVDDEAAIVDFLRDALEDEGYTVYAAFDGNQAVRLAQQHRPDLVILDILLPGDDGFAVCQALRQNFAGPLLFLSAKQEEADKVMGLSVGADDYVIKPFSIKELLARVAAHLRRQRHSQLRSLPMAHVRHLHFGKLMVDLGAYEARYAGALLALTRKEFEVLRLLMLHPQQVFSREHLYERIWGMDSLGSTETVTEHIKRIRQKLAVHDPQTEYIGTVWGVGYKWIRSRSL